MPDNLLTIIKKAALDAVNATRPVNVVFGVLASVSPLSVTIDQKLTLEAGFLVLTKHIDDLILSEELTVGDRLVLIQMQGGSVAFILGGRHVTAQVAHMYKGQLPV